MRSLLRSPEFDALVFQGPQVYPFEQTFSPAEQDRRNRKMQFVNEALAKILLDRVRPTADPHVPAGSRLACTLERLAYASRDEVERRAAFHLDGWTRMMGQYEDWKMIGWIVPPPAF